ncbi:unnamed protein product, partial [Trichogramma brassicae]
MKIPLANVSSKLRRTKQQRRLQSMSGLKRKGSRRYTAALGAVHGHTKRAWRSYWRNGIPITFVGCGGRISTLFYTSFARITTIKIGAVYGVIASRSAFAAIVSCANCCSGS